MIVVLVRHFGSEAMTIPGLMFGFLVGVCEQYEEQDNRPVI